MLRLLGGLSRQFLFELLTSAVLSFHEVDFPLLSSLLLLRLDDVLHVSSPRLLLFALLIVPQLRHSLLCLRLLRHLLLPLGSLHLAVGNGLDDRLLDALVHLAFHCFVHFLFLLAVLLGLLAQKVSLSLRDDLIRSFPRLVDLFHDLRHRWLMVRPSIQNDNLLFPLPF